MLGFYCNKLGGDKESDCKSLPLKFFPLSLEFIFLLLVILFIPNITLLSKEFISRILSLISISNSKQCLSQVTTGKSAVKSKQQTCEKQVSKYSLIERLKLTRRMPISRRDTRLPENRNKIFLTRAQSRY